MKPSYKMEITQEMIDSVKRHLPLIWYAATEEGFNRKIEDMLKQVFEQKES